jgi:predicted transcriptional regulator of viral defense system
VALLADWERARRKHITIEDLSATVGKSAAKVAAALVRKGALQRLQKGLYLIRPFRSLLRPTTSSAPMAVASLLHGEPYYLGGLWVYSHHGFTEQQYVSMLDAFVTRRRPARTLAGAKVVFHPRNARFFEYGVGETNIEGVAVRVSDPERTIVDMLDYPKLVGGLRRAVELFSSALPSVDAHRVADYAVLGSRTSTCQRVGVILERTHASAAALRSLKRRVRAVRSVTSMVPGRRTGPVNRTWNVVENDRGLDATAAP